MAAGGSMPTRLLLIFCLTAPLFRRGRGTSPTPEQEHLYCGEHKYEIGSAYADNLGWLLPNLTGDVIRDGAIYYRRHASKWGNDPDAVGSVAMCYADHSREDCAQCLRYVADRFHNGLDCPNARTASAFYDACLLLYFNFSTGEISDYGSRYVSIVGLDLTSSDVAESFHLERDVLLQNLSTQAASSKLYAAANSTKYGYGNGAQSIYGLVQCDRTITRDECVACLTNLTLSIDSDPTNAYMTIGKLKGYWCYIRYGTVQFDDHISEYMTATSPNASATAPATAPTTALPPPSHQGRPRRAMI